MEEHTPHPGTGGPKTVQMADQPRLSVAVDVTPNSRLLLCGMGQLDSKRQNAKSGQGKVMVRNKNQRKKMCTSLEVSKETNRTVLDLMSILHCTDS